MVNEYGKKWRFKFNAGKSAVLVFGEDKKTNHINSSHRVFRLGKESVKEREVYDHVGVKMSIFEDSTARVEEKISKGRKTLNASSGLGLRKNGLNMGTCNLIFWQVVVPTITFGSEVWICSEKDEHLLLSFQHYAGRRVQRFPFRSPNATSFYGLGWLKLTSYIRVKKLLFILSVLKMDPRNILRTVFTTRPLEFDGKMVESRQNSFGSPIFDILNVAIIFGVYNSVKMMFLNELSVVSKKAWSKLIWERAWTLEGANWIASNAILKENDLLTMTVGSSRYQTWWKISDSDYRLTGMCETMSKIICHASLLKSDDVRLKGMPTSNKTCIMCDHYCIEDIRHILIQCPYYHVERSEMYEEIFIKCPNAKRIFEQNRENAIFFLLGREIPFLGEEEMYTLWCISGKMISKMYKKAVTDRLGID